MMKKNTYKELEQKVKTLQSAEDECQKAVKVIEEYINSLPGLFYVLDKEGMVRWNREWNIIGGYKDEEIKGRYGVFFFEGDDRKRAKEFAAKVFRDGASSFEASLMTKDGRRIPYYFTGTRKRLDGKDYLVGLGIDITERKKEEKERQRLQKQLQQSYRIKAIGTLAGGIAHKFNNALCEITGNIELFKMANPNSKDIDKYMDRMLASVSNMSNLSNQLLAYAEGGKYQPKAMSLSDVIDSTLAIIITRKLASAIRVETDIPSDISDITGDQAQIQMLISAIIENAAESIEKKGRIRILVRDEDVDDEFAKDYLGLKPGSYVCMRVIDDGKGMDEETSRRIFEPFFTTNFYGRGLGMAAAYGIVKNHYGWIGVDSEPGKGTTVSIYLPAVKKQAQRIETGNVLAYTGKGNILIIEDEEMVMTLGKVMLEKMGHKVLTAGNGKEALDILKTFNGVIDVVLLDMGLPDIRGKELYPMLMAIRPKLKVIIFSGYSIDGPAREVLNAGANAFIQKPFVYSDLFKKVNEMMDRRQFKRFQARGDASVILKSSPLLVLNIMNISKGGLAFTHGKNDFPVDKRDQKDELAIHQAGKDPLLDHIPCRVVTDQPQPDDASTGPAGRMRCGVEFDSLSPDQMAGLDHVIASIAH